jgi:hypothetical protein
MSTTPNVGNEAPKQVSAKLADKNLQILIGVGGGAIALGIGVLLMFKAVGIVQNWFGPVASHSPPSSSSRSGTVSGPGPVQPGPGPGSSGQPAGRAKEVADLFLSDIRARRFPAAYDRTSKFFKDDRSIQEFEGVLEDSSFVNATDLQYKARESDNLRVLFRGYAAGKNGKTAFSLEVVQDNDELWKVNRFKFPDEG